MDKRFSRSVASVYQDQLVPLIFAPYATDLAERVAHFHPAKLLELAAGTGVVTRALAAALPSTTSILATDLHQSMLDQADRTPIARPVEWRQADAMALPFPDQSFDMVVCQFGVMFFPDKAGAFAEALRVLCPGGLLLFNAWDRLEENEFAHSLSESLDAVFPDDPPRFMANVPHGYHHIPTIREDLARAGFAAADITTVSARSRAESAAVPAVAYCHGTPLRNELEMRAPSRLDEITAAVADGIARRFGSGPVDGKIQAHVVLTQREG